MSYQPRPGDTGLTRDFTGASLPKDDPRIIVLAKIDSLLSSIDQLLLSLPEEYREVLLEIQETLSATAAEISRCPLDHIPSPCAASDTERLERRMQSLPSPKKFVRFTTQNSVYANEARLRARELETAAVKLLRTQELRPEVFGYFNRLSSFFFLLAYALTSFP